MPTQESIIIEDMLEPLADALTPETAKLFSTLRAKPAVQARINYLAAKCNEGDLTPDERAEYEDFVRVGHLFALLKVKANKVLAESSHG